MKDFIIGGTRQEITVDTIMGQQIRSVRRYKIESLGREDGKEKKYDNKDQEDVNVDEMLKQT